MANARATLGGGCFWCLEAVFVEVEGVRSVTSGYAGGHTDDPTYREVCDETTGHAEVVQVEFDDDVISLREILEVFFAIHDPTTRDRQGADVGSQYRSIILTHDEAQAQIAGELITELDREEIWPNPIVTQVEPLGDFYEAEDYHQDYFARNTSQGYCQVVVAPKLTKFRQRFADRLKRAPSIS